MENEISNLQIEKKIFVIRGVQVMVDRDIAELYGVETRRLNEQVKRNIERFPEEFMFQMNDEEFENWKSQIVALNTNPVSDENLISQFVISRSQKATLNNEHEDEILMSQFATSSWGGIRKAPYVFTEHGVTMLASVLKSETAVKSKYSDCKGLCFHASFRPKQFANLCRA